MEEKIIEKITEKINKIAEEGINVENLETLEKLINIHKNLSNEKYWEIKEEVYKMKYNNYDNYDEYNRRGRYGRRGVPGSGRGRYRGEYAIDEMQDHYMNYNESVDEMDRGNYGAESNMLKSVDAIMKNICEIVEELAESDNPEVMRIIKKHAKKIEEM